MPLFAKGNAAHLTPSDSPTALHLSDHVPDDLLAALAFLLQPSPCLSRMHLIAVRPAVLTTCIFMCFVLVMLCYAHQCCFRLPRMSCEGEASGASVACHGLGLDLDSDRDAHTEPHLSQSPNQIHRAPQPDMKV